MTLVGVEYPAFEAVARKLVTQHLNHPEDDRLLLAAYYAPERAPQDIFVFEVFENFGSKLIDEGRNLFEVSFPSTPALPLEQGQYLHLVLTNPEELPLAIAEGWPLLKEFQQAALIGRATLLYNDQKGAQIWRLING